MKKILCAIIGLFAMTAHAATTDVCDFDIANIYKVGTPTITNAGIYTTNSSESYIRTQNDVAFATANTWSFKWRFTYHPANSDQGIMSGNGDTNVQAIINSEGRPRFSFGNGTNWNAGVWNDTTLTFAYQDGVTYDNEIYFDGTRYGFKVNGTEIGGVDNTTKAANTYFAIGVERGRVSTQYSRAEWDLTHTSLTLDGVEQLPWCGKQIKVATTKYVESEFAPMVSALQSAISVVDSVVSRTITQAASIATLQSGKQTRPADDTCPAYKQCLLVEDESGTPHWYQITDPFRDFVTPIIANNVAPASTTEQPGYTQLEYIESTGTQYIDTGIAENTVTNLEIEFETTSSSNTGFIFVNGTSQVGIMDSRYSLSTPGRYTITESKNGSGVWVVHNVTTGTSFVNMSPATENRIALFNLMNGDGNIGQFYCKYLKIYYFKAYNGDTLVQHLVPAKRNSDSAIGMYDTVSRTFFTNSGTGTFTAGPTVANTDVPANGTWTATWAANATTGVTAGTVYGEGLCNAVTGTFGVVATSTQLSSSNWNTTGTGCWCKVSGLTVGGEYSAAPSSISWVFRYTYSSAADCVNSCAYGCANNVRSYASFRSAVFGM